MLDMCIAEMWMNRNRAVLQFQSSALSTVTDQTVMAPSRGLLLVSTLPRYAISPLRKRFSSSLANLASNETRRFQVYISRTLDPYLNLSIEHYLLQKTPADSTILFIYTNRPCIVIGRNQNPWVEVNLGLLNNALPSSRDKAGKSTVDLVRRRSGGGTVFHDEGNVNYSVICPTSVFDRDKHAAMVVRALHTLGVDKAQVNERHDIILAGSEGRSSSDPDAAPKPHKISGSAYKLTRLRSLHHGTCLLSSPNIKTIGRYLRSPLKPFITARGVDSVSSPVTNVNISNRAFEEAVVSEFAKMYDTSAPPITLADETAAVPEIAKGLAELSSREWMYLQTPQFTFDNRIAIESLAGQLTIVGPPDDAANQTHLAFTARNGAITEWELGDRFGNELSRGSKEGAKVHEIGDWCREIGDGGHARSFGSWLNGLFGKVS